MEKKKKKLEYVCIGNEDVIQSHYIPKAAKNIFASGFSYPTSEDMMTASNLIKRRKYIILGDLLYSRS